MNQEGTIAMNRLYLMTFALINVLVTLDLEARGEPWPATTREAGTVTVIVDCDRVVNSMRGGIKDTLPVNSLSIYSTYRLGHDARGVTAE